MSALGQQRTSADLLDHLVGAGENSVLDCNTEALRGRLMANSNFVGCSIGTPQHPCATDRQREP
jgi:hypothetical protein